MVGSTPTPLIQRRRESGLQGGGIAAIPALPMFPLRPACGCCFRPRGGAPLRLPQPSLRVAAKADCSRGCPKVNICSFPSSSFPCHILSPSPHPSPRLPLPLITGPYLSARRVYPPRRRSTPPHFLPLMHTAPPRRRHCHPPTAAAFMVAASAAMVVAAPPLCVLPPRGSDLRRHCRHFFFHTWQHNAVPVAQSQQRGEPHRQPKRVARPDLPSTY